MRVLGPGGRVRRGLGRLRAAAGRVLDPPGLILLYHRVARPGVDPWGISVRPGHFAEHLEVLRGAARPVSLEEITRGGRGRRVALTFDDGYADNLGVALPLLERADVPATIFVASGSVGQSRPFWWDELGHLLLRPRELPGELRLEFGGRSQRWTLGEGALPAASPGGWRAETDPEAGPRQRLYLDLYWRLRGSSPPEREAALSALRAWAGGGDPGEDHTLDPGRPVTGPELAELAAHPLLDIGAHTVTHPPLADLDPAGQWAEVRESRAALEAWTGHPVTSFSFPYGSRGEESAPLVRRAGFLRACTSVSGPVRRRSDPYALPRVSVGDWTGEEFAARLAHWLN